MVTVTFGTIKCRISRDDFIKILDSAIMDNALIDRLYTILSAKRSPFSLASRLRFLESLRNEDISNEARAKIVEFILQEV